MMIEKFYRKIVSQSQLCEEVQTNQQSIETDVHEMSVTSESTSLTGRLYHSLNDQRSQCYLVQLQ